MGQLVLSCGKKTRWREDERALTEDEDEDEEKSGGRTVTAELWRTTT